MRTSIWFCIIAVLLPNILAAVEDVPTYEKDIAPLLKRSCIRCHSASARKGGLDLSTPHGLFKGGESESTLIPGDMDGSYLYELLHERMMPPEGEGKRLTEEEVHTIGIWIEKGTPFADGTDPATFVAAAEVNQHDIQPIMMLRCTVCHGNRRREGGLDLRTRESMLAGGKSGPAIVLGKPEESLLLKRIHAEEMPPRDKLLPSGVKVIPGGELKELTRWIALGAPQAEILPDVASAEPDPLVTDEDREFWAFQSLQQVTPPAARGTMGLNNTIDLFIAAKLHAQKLRFSPVASRATLVRRAYYDLTGLPPTPAQITAFVNDQEPLAYERLVEQLLASPGYGERWARFWLDTAGYADSEGKRSADPIRNSAWRYRDYVIRSINADIPYSRFLIEQIAGDELLDYSDPAQITPAHVRNLVATGFLRMAPDGTGSDVVNSVPERMEVVADEIDIFSSTVLALTMKCARCHTHKYDPIPQRDYYRLVATFQGAFDVHDWLKPTAVPGQTDGVMKTRSLSVATPEAVAKIGAWNVQIDKQIQQQQDLLTTEEARIKSEFLASGVKALPAVIREDVRQAFELDTKSRNEVQQYLFGKFKSTLMLADDQLQKNTGFAALKKKVNDALTELQGERQEIEPIRALWDRGEPSPTYLFVRGDHRQPGRLIGPGVPSVLTDGKTPFVSLTPDGDAVGTGRRSALANWLVDPQHPLTARVMVNRLWAHHFGRGIVSSVDNFGALGVRPTHPELLDWLANYFVQSDWSMKDLHRLIMTSRTYRQSSITTEEHMEKDPDNLYLSHVALRRLTAEEVRDSVIAIAGNLKENQFGRPDPVNVRGDGLVTAVGEQGIYRRSIYLRQRRKEMPSFLETFDLPQMNPACQQRPTSNVAQQALYLLNSSMVRDLAAEFASNVRARSDGKMDQVKYMYLAVTGAEPGSAERELAMETLDQLETQWKAEVASLPQEKQKGLDPALKALETFGHALWNSAGFLYVD